MSALQELPVDDDRRRQLDFLVAAHRLTEVQRFTRTLNGSRGETSAEHSWHTALTAIVLASTDADEVNLGRALSMLIIHDIVEVQVGDVPIYDHLARQEVAPREHAAANQLFGRLPEPDALGVIVSVGGIRDGRDKRREICSSS